MIKKIALLIILLFFIVGLSYVKVIRKNDQIDSAYVDGRNESESQLNRVELDNDSLKNLINQKESDYKDSLLNKDFVYVSTTDSLHSKIDSLDNTVSELKNKLKSSEKQLAQVNKSKKVGINTQKSRHEEILSSYKKRYRSLPSDLSDYERKVAISEIRAETANQYKISVAELNRMRSDHNIEF